MRCIHAYQEFPATARRPALVKCAILRDCVSPNHPTDQVGPAEFCEKACDMRNRPLKDLPDAPVMQRVIKGCIRAVCLSGELPRVPHVVNMRAAFARFRALAGYQEARALLRRMFLRQAAIKEQDGGLPATALAARFREIAQAEGMEDVLDQLVERHRVAR